MCPGINTSQMKTQTTIQTHLPEVFSTAIPALATREDYIAFRDEWRLTYKHISLRLQEEKCWTCANMRPEKAAYRKTRAKAIAEQLKALPPSKWLANAASPLPYKGWEITPENTGNPQTRKRTVYGLSALATWMLWLRREAKRQRREQRQQELAARTLTAAS